jgi:hypothetical protein
MYLTYLLSVVSLLVGSLRLLVTVRFVFASLRKILTYKVSLAVSG